MAGFNTKNVVIICVSCLLALGMICGVIVHESIINHRKGPWVDKVTVTVDKDGKATQE